MHLQYPVAMYILPRGIMAHFNNEAQFAGVLGHETVLIYT